MIDNPLQMIPGLIGALPFSPFPPTSRYAGLETVQLEMADGETIVYVRRRFVPQPERFTVLQEHTVTQGDRLDNVTSQYLGDPEQFWRLCDANRALRPDELTETVGRKLDIALPEGLSGAVGA